MKTTSPEPEFLPVAQSEAVSIQCRHLRSKGMYVYSDRAQAENRDDYDCSAYWCLKSMTNFGPDDHRVGKPECDNPSRSCHQPI
jgi:hypothetical protein